MYYTTLTTNEISKESINPSNEINTTETIEKQRIPTRQKSSEDDQSICSKALGSRIEGNFFFIQLDPDTMKLTRKLEKKKTNKIITRQLCGF